jgi:putative adhesin
MSATMIRMGRFPAAASRWILATVVTVATGVGPMAAWSHDDHGSDKRPRRAGEDFEWSGRVAPGKSIEIKGVNGGIVAEAGTGSEVEVVARKSARRSDPDEVTIEVVEHADGITLCAVYPTPRGDRPNQCGPGERGRMNTKNNDVTVEFTVRVPAGVRFIGRTVNGSIEARGLKADVEAYTVNGSIGVATRGVARATTVNGSIDAEMGTAANDPLEFETVNGGITLTVPAGSGAEIHASTVNGDISTDFPLTVRGKFSRRSINGTIGRGGPPLSMTTVNGDIRLRSAS